MQLRDGHGQDVITVVRNYEKVKTKWMKVDQDKIYKIL